MKYPRRGICLNKKSMDYDTYTFVTSQRGKRLLKVGPHRFCIQSRSGIKVRWVCSTHNHRGCRAVVHTIDDEIIRINNIHNHNHQTSRTGLVARIVMTERGTLKLYLDGYTYHRQVTRSSGAKTRWRCRSGNDSCKAVVFTVDDDLVMQKGEHNHPPTN
ncbi:FLYWCH zinc finger domain-containing protein [Phthorimaea operculella]|nr:FLYWCH zinc finger domain-containing protein [Phthorimaea operculella]